MCVGSAMAAAFAAAIAFTMNALSVPLQIVGWVSFGLLTVWFLSRAPQVTAFRQSFIPMTPAEEEAERRQAEAERRHYETQRQRAEQQRHEAEQRHARYKSMGQRYREASKQRRLTYKHRRRIERHQRWLDIRRGLGMAPTGAEALYDRVLTPEPIDWSDPDLRRWVCVSS